MSAAAHVVFGTGPAGRSVAHALLEQGEQVRMVNRSGRPAIADVETVGGDASDPDFATEVAAGAATLYFCLNAPSYREWPQQFPPLQRAVLTAARANSAMLVALENLYLYGPALEPLRETRAPNPTSAKARTRAAMASELLAAHERGDVRVAIGRAADFVGPGVRDSAFGARVVGRAVAGKKAQTMGRPDLPHTYSYVPDIGRNLVLLGERPEAAGRAWHLPNPPTRTTRELILDVYRAAGSRRSSVTALTRPMIGIVGVVSRDARELLHTYYQFDAPFVVDDTAFRTHLGGHTTDWDEIILTTVASFS